MKADVMVRVKMRKKNSVVPKLPHKAEAIHKKVCARHTMA